jgi:diguanylate cyclase (GGDEF)-like protein
MFRARYVILLVAAVVTIAAALWATSQLQRRAVLDSSRLTAAADAMLVGMLDQETAVRGFRLTGEDRFLSPYIGGRAQYRAARARAGRELSGEARFERLLTRQDADAARWSAWARSAQREHAVARSPRTIAISEEGRRLMNRFRRSNDALTRALAARTDSQLARARWTTVAVMTMLALLFGGAFTVMAARGRAALHRRNEEDERYHATQREFSEVFQEAEDEAAAHEVLCIHLERSIPGARVVVLTRNNSADRLRAGTELPEGSELRRALEDARPASCIAAKLARRYEHDPEHDGLRRCRLCDCASSPVTCVPLTVGGEVVGAVQVAHDGELDSVAQRRIQDSVAIAGPVLANLRNLAIAESRAATDALTGLPNRRGIQDALSHQIAHAAQALDPFSLILFDLDRFKAINDGHGHEKGDLVLAAVAETARATLRDGDFVGRSGGEEFIVLLPGTDAAGAMVTAEKLRRAIAGITVPGVDRPITASLGVATFPDESADGAGLMRLADRALYAAKRDGRNRVERAVLDRPGDGIASRGGNGSARSRPIRVFVWDDAAELRELTRAIVEPAPDIEVCGDAGAGRGGVERIAALQPDVVLLDLVMPGLDGAAAVPLIREAAPGARIVLRSGLAGLPTAEGLRGQVDGTVGKDAPAAAVLAAIRDAAAPEPSRAR